MYAGEVGNLAGVGTGVHAFGVALAADFDGGGEVDFQKTIFANHAGGALANLQIRSQEGRDADQAGVVDELGHFGAAAEVLSRNSLNKKRSS